jgi:hypothetical protein
LKAYKRTLPVARSISLCTFPFVPSSNVKGIRIVIASCSVGGISWRTPGERFGDENGHQLGTTGPILNGIKRYVWQIFLQYKDCRQISSAMLPGPIWEVSNCGLSERLACEATRFKKRNISGTIVADVKRFSHQINTGEVFDTHRSSPPILQSLTFRYSQGDACPPISTSIGTFPIFTCQPSPRPNGFLSNES